MAGIDVSQYPSSVGELLSPEREGALDAGTPNEAVRAKLAALKPADVVGSKPKDADMAQACLAGLWLYHDFLSESHAISQDVHTTTGSYWHGILHRREGDYGNAKYWFRQVGGHPVFTRLATAARAEPTLTAAAGPIRELLDRSVWDANRFVDLCREACGGRSDLGPMLRRLQAIEWRTLFDFCFESAGGRR